MTLEFEKVRQQVERMGRALAARHVDLSERATDAWEQFQQLDDLTVIRDRVQLARQRNARYRGAAPVFHHETGELFVAEPINQAYVCPPAPQPAVIMAADGSQVYPNLHAAALYYLMNIGIFVYHHGRDQLPEQITEPWLYYNETDIRDKQGQLITTDTVNKRRSVMEVQILAREAWHRRDSDIPILAINDGQLLFWVKKDVPDGRQLEKDYLGALIHLHDTHAAMQREHKQTASLIGYIDRPNSTFLVSLLHLMRLPEASVRVAALATNGELEGLTDQQVLTMLLGDKPGARTALMIQQSPRNKDYRKKSENLEIAFFYINVGQPGSYHLARVELPLWVARDPEAVQRVQSLVYDQCQIMWRYPYALTRADELAVIRTHERSQLEGMIKQILLENQQPVAHSQKEQSKSIRHGRTRYGQKRRAP